LEAAILREMERFILKLGAGFTFVARQERIVIVGTDFYIDLLFYRRKLHRLIAVELKLAAFQAADKEQGIGVALSETRRARHRLDRAQQDRYIGRLLSREVPERSALSGSL
jgi:hypothetical protein